MLLRRENEKKTALALRENPRFLCTAVGSIDISVNQVRHIGQKSSLQEKIGTWHELCDLTLCGQCPRWASARGWLPFANGGRAIPPPDHSFFAPSRRLTRRGQRRGRLGLSRDPEAFTRDGTADGFVHRRAVHPLDDRQLPVTVAGVRAEKPPFQPLDEPGREVRVARAAEHSSFGRQPPSVPDSMNPRRRPPRALIHTRNLPPCPGTRAGSP